MTASEIHTLKEMANVYWHQYSKTGDKDLMGVGLGEEKIALSFTSCLYFQIMYIEAGNVLAIYW